MKMASENRNGKRCKTGITGLDEILGGGFPSNRLYLIQGSPGCGKTTLALQFLLEGLKAGERGLYISLSETREELYSVAESHGWSLDGLSIIELSAIEPQLNRDQENTFFHPSEIELNKTTRLLSDEVEKVKPSRIAIDSLSELRLLSENQLRYRRQMLAFKQFFSGRNITVLLLDDGTSPEGDAHLQSIAHGVVSLERSHLSYGVQRRRLSVIKLRGVQFREGNHDFVICPGGLHVFPRLVISEHHVSYQSENVSCGIPELDALLGGGLGRGTSSLLVGPAGVGKSTVAIQFALAAARRGESVVVYTFDETLQNVLKRSMGLHQDLRPYLQSGKFINIQVDPAELAPGEFSHNIKDKVGREKTQLVIIDSLNGYLNAMPDERYLMMQLHELQTYLNQQGVVSIMTMAQHGMVGSMSTPVDVTYLADTVLLFRFFEVIGRIKKAISVVKKRTGFHEDTIRELNTGTNGISIGKPLTEFQGVLTGVPKFFGDPADILKTHLAAVS